MTDPVIAHLLTDQGRDAFARAGYLQLPDALDGPTVEALQAIAMDHFAKFRAGADVTRFHVLNEHDLVGKEPAWLELADQPTTFPKVWGLMGWNIQLFHTQLIVTPSAPANAERGAYGWHQDNNRMNRDFDTELHPMVSVKVGYFLTDLPDPGMGNLCVAPGSHKLAADELPRSAEHAVELTARAGDAVIFDRRLWHAASTNCSTTTRVFLTYGYSYRWLRPKSAMQIGSLYDTLDPIRRQLLGHATSANGYYDPQPDDVPLREWIRENVGDAAVAP